MRTKLIAKRKAAHDEQGRLLAACEKDVRGFTDDEQSRFDALDTEIRGLDAAIERADKHEERTRTLSAPADEPLERGDGTEVGATREEDRPFRSFGDFLQVVARSSTPGAKRDIRLEKRAASGSSEAVDSDGGFLVDTQFMPGILKEMHAGDEVLKRCTKATIGAGFNGIRANGVDETSRANGSRWGGVQAYWASEAGTVTASKPKFRRINMDLEKLFAIYYATDEVLQDATLLQSLATQAFAEELRFKATDAVVRGTGAGQPLGFTAADSVISVSGETGQTADTVILENVQKMWVRRIAARTTSYVWLANQEIEPQLDNLFLAVGTGGIPVYMPPGGVSGNPYGTLKGRPVIFIEQAAALGDAGDLMLVDLSDYLLIEKGGITGDQSAHVRFLYGEQTFRFTYRLNGQPLRASAITPYKATSGQTLSPYITLAARS